MENASVPNTNEVAVSGVVKKIWSNREGHILARLAVYDEHAEQTGITDALGRPEKTPHRVTLLFPHSQVGGVAVNLRKFERIQVQGYLVDSVYYESLYTFAQKSRSEPLLALLEKPENQNLLREVSIARVATYVVVESMVEFTR